MDLCADCDEFATAVAERSESSLRIGCFPGGGRDKERVMHCPLCSLFRDHISFFEPKYGSATGLLLSSPLLVRYWGWSIGWTGDSGGTELYLYLFI